MTDIHINVSGHVQGVGFRYFTQMKAREYQIAGWVRNKDNGTVEVYASGREKDLAMFLSCLKRGNRFSKVEKVTVAPLNSDKRYYDFVIKS
ncbi:acylphosphatase [Peribacillus sp. SCS-155]|uniref:acylphosphatase n=1 Tax=Peribacillus sedimenti TaxID=3115297 RepID=UPI0039061D25